MIAGLVVIIALALTFDFINGFHDAANSIATVVSTRVLTPGQAVVWAAFFNFIAFLVFSTHIAGNIARGVDPAVVSIGLVGAGLVGAVIWGLLTWWWGLPTSSSHALLGGLAGAAIMKGGFGVLDYTFFAKTLVFIVIAPVLGLLLGLGYMRLVMLLFGRKSPGSVDRLFRRAQLVSAALYSLGHGGNDAQKTMGIIVAALIASGHLGAAPTGAEQHVPFWVVLVCHAAMGAGTLSGGWRIVKTMGMGITKLAPVGGFSAETAGASTLFMATVLGIPVSTTHTITGAIVGVGTVQRFSAIRWRVAGRIVWAWIFTVPAAAAVSALALLVLRAIGVPV
ncbi:MAG: inorganic phosphate transporter [Labilithrix sp.]|nr:inorganic phosphate transporter [Labilithrix sp.]MCW5810128.1 inorganic phosphate transporter [Labilithrix sp.]